VAIPEDPMDVIYDGRPLAYEHGGNVRR
jgi:hypothetical protein